MLLDKCITYNIKIKKYTTKYILSNVTKNIIFEVCKLVYTLYIQENIKSTREILRERQNLIRLKKRDKIPIPIS